MVCLHKLSSERKSFLEEFYVVHVKKGVRATVRSVGKRAKELAKLEKEKILKDFNENQAVHPKENAKEPSLFVNPNSTSEEKGPFKTFVGNRLNEFSEGGDCFENIPIIKESQFVSVNLSTPVISGAKENSPNLERNAAAGRKELIDNFFSLRAS